MIGKYWQNFGVHYCSIVVHWSSFDNQRELRGCIFVGIEYWKSGCFVALEPGSWYEPDLERCDREVGCFDSSVV